MFYRTGLKLQARNRMRGYLGNAILVSLICSLLLGGFSTSRDFSDLSGSAETTNLTTNLHFQDILSPVLLGAIATISVFALLGGLAYQIFFANILKVGKYGWFMRYSRGEYPSVGQLFSAFRIYKPTMVTMLVRDLYVLLWSLLFVIPGIVQSYAYRLVPYILYENPNLRAEEALQISKDIMRGNKMDLFIFDCSFFLWNVLSAITGGLVGILYVTPYYCTAEAMIYDALKTDAVYRRRIVSPAVFHMPETQAETTF